MRRKNETFRKEVLSLNASLAKTIGARQMLLVQLEIPATKFMKIEIFSSISCSNVISACGLQFAHNFVPKFDIDHTF